MTTKSMPKQTMQAAVESAEALIRAAAVAQREADQAAAVPARRLSVRAWVSGATRQGGFDAGAIAKLRDTLETRGQQFASLSAYVHGIAISIGTGEWRGGPPTAFAPAPHTWRADRAAAELEISTLGLGLWVAVALAVEHAAERYPEAFGDVDDVTREEQERTAPMRAAARALEEARELHPVIALGLAVLRGLDLEPRANLIDRLIADEINPAPRRPARARVAAGEAQFLKTEAVP